MTLEQHLKQMIGQLAFELAAARAEIDRLTAQLAVPKDTS